MRKLLIPLLVLVVVGAGVAFFLLKKNNVVLDSGEVERMAAQMLPGARPPAGLKGVLGLHPEGLEVAIFAPGLAQVKPDNLNGSDLRIIMAKPTAPEPPTPQDFHHRNSPARAPGPWRPTRACASDPASGHSRCQPGATHSGRGGRQPCATPRCG